MHIVEYLEGTVELGAGARGQVAQGPQLVEGRLTAALLLGGVQGLVVEAVLHAHPVTFLQGKAQQVDFVSGVAVPLLGGKPVKRKLLKYFSFLECRQQVRGGGAQGGFSLKIQRKLLYVITLGRR
jgi:hypothetical protein